MPKAVSSESSPRQTWRSKKTQKRSPERWQKSRDQFLKVAFPCPHDETFGWTMRGESPRHAPFLRFHFLYYTIPSSRRACRADSSNVQVNCFPPHSDPGTKTFFCNTCKNGISPK